MKRFHSIDEAISDDASDQNPDVTIHDFNRQRAQTLAFARSTNADTGQGVVNRIMILTDEMGAIAIEETRIGEIKAQREMTAAIFVSDEPALVPGKKTFGRFAALGERKFHRSAFGDIIGASDFQFRHGLRLFGGNRTDNPENIKAMSDKLRLKRCSRSSALQQHAFEAGKYWVRD